jgi:hypothetical protein
MRIDGHWATCEEGESRPVLRAEVECSDGSWLPCEFLLDTGADLTAFTAQFMARLAVARHASDSQIGGVGGRASVAYANTRVRCMTDEGTPVFLRGNFPIVEDDEYLDLPVLGRDISRLFAVIVDLSGNTVCLLSQRHRYRIESA